MSKTSEKQGALMALKTSFSKASQEKKLIETRVTKLEQEELKMLKKIEETRRQAGELVLKKEMNELKYLEKVHMK